MDLLEGGDFMAIGSLKEEYFRKDEISIQWLDELTIPVAPACNLMCNFCSKDSDCVCNGNSPQFLSKSMTPRQAVNYAILSTLHNKRIKAIKISGPGEPLFNSQTFEVLKRLNIELPEYILSVSTNGLILKDKVQELCSLNVKRVEVSINGFKKSVVRNLCSRIILDNYVIINSDRMADTLINAQKDGIKECINKGIDVKVNTIYIPKVNDSEIFDLAHKCRSMGVKSMRVISSKPGGKMSTISSASISDLVSVQQKLMKIMDEVEIKDMAV